MQHLHCICAYCQTSGCCNCRFITSNSIQYQFIVRIEYLEILRSQGTIRLRELGIYSSRKITSHNRYGQCCGVGLTIKQMSSLNRVCSSILRGCGYSSNSSRIGIKCQTLWKSRGNSETGETNKSGTDVDSIDVLTKDVGRLRITETNSNNGLIRSQKIPLRELHATISTSFFGNLQTILIEGNNVANRERFCFISCTPIDITLGIEKIEVFSIE